MRLHSNPSLRSGRTGERVSWCTIERVNGTKARLSIVSGRCARCVDRRNHFPGNSRTFATEQGNGFIALIG